ncbi:lipocalin-like domain-containing protein [Rubrivirga sp. IMCC43871]|uniref:lipocalin-like domain-containing protein n=1 Tax=Rubrivirga sp. IMCC43871 TaxID=3391575 RepID=UPI00398FAF18
MLRLSLALALILAACAGTPPRPAGLDGAWQLVSAQAFDASGALVYDPEVQTGLLVVGGGRYSFVWTRTPRPPAAQPWAATEAERLVSFATMIAHAGRLVAVAPDTVRAEAEAAKSPEFAGGHETFARAVEGDTLRLTAVWAEAGDGTPVPFYASGGRQRYVFVRAR